MKRIFYFTEATCQKGHCSETAFFATAKEAIAAAKRDWGNLCRKDREDETVAACICITSDEELQQIMEREDWDTPEGAINSISHDFLAFYSFKDHYEKTLLIADTINGVQEVADFYDLNFTYVNDCFFLEALETLSDAEIIGTVAESETVAKISEIYGISKN